MRLAAIGVALTALAGAAWALFHFTSEPRDSGGDEEGIEAPVEAEATPPAIVPAPDPAKSAAPGQPAVPEGERAARESQESTEAGPDDAEAQPPVASLLAENDLCGLL